MTLRWTLLDPATSETYTLPQNPNLMDSPTLAERTITVPSIGGIRTMRSGRLPTTWSFSGSVRLQADYSALLGWKSHDLIHITDHRSRVLEVIPLGFEPTPKRITDRPWGFTYKFTGLYLGRVS